MLAFLLSAVVALQAGDVIDRTLALVSGRTITLSDARTAVALGLVPGTQVDADVVRRLIDRELMLREAERYQPPEPPDQRVDAAVERVVARAGGEAEAARIFVAGGFDRARLRAWLRDDLRVDAYLQQRFAVDDRRQDLISDWVSDLRRRAQITVFGQ